MTRADHAHSGYLPAVDGLRAVAVLSVVGFHAGVPGVPGVSGGFVGVDVFFVISGFLITGLLVREWSDTGRIDLAGFYARRIRRLLPALCVVVAATLGLGQVMLTAVGEQQALASSALATSAFVANIYFWRTQTGYFAGASEELPLLHMWTLAVEEQFYIGWPLVLIIVGVVARRRGLAFAPILAAILAAATLLSLAACAIVTPIKPTAAFYLTPFRAWQFGFGALVALAADRVTGWPAIWVSRLALAGLAAIAVSVTTFTTLTPFPGLTALLPTAGAGLVILAIAVGPKSAATAVLASSPLVAIGKLSYAWYLWHWPLLALARASALGQPDLVRDIGIVLLALALAAATYVFIESPIRMGRRGPFAGRAPAIATGGALLVALATGAGLSRNAADAALAADPALAAFHAARAEAFPYPAGCSHYRYPFAGLAPVEGCLVGADRGAMAVLWGDSNAYHFIPMLAAAGRAQGIRVLPRASGDCRPYTHTTPPAVRATKELDFAENCARFNQAVLDSLPALKKSGATTVILAARWSAWPRYLRPGSEWETDLRSVIESITAQGLDVLLIADVPGFPWNVPLCLTRRSAAECTRPRNEVDDERRAALASLDLITRQVPGVTLWDPIDEVCERDACVTERTGRFLYSDRQHLSVTASAALADAVVPALARKSLNTGVVSAP